MTPFAKKVYKAVLSIPLGEVRTYQWVAKKIGKPGAWRAVGTALKNNPYPFIIPCHRVVKGDSKPGGYVFGAKKKRLILDLETKIAKCLDKE